MMIKDLLFILALIGAVPAPVKPGTTVMVVASMHGYHAHHPTYDYENLYAVIGNFRPDLVGVEIRPEDVHARVDYLQSSYPREMISLRDKYADRIVGFDWLGDEIAGRPIPEGWWQHGSTIKALERKLDADPAMKDADAESISRDENELLKSATAASLADGRYYKLVQEEHARLARRTAGTPYAPIAQFTAARDRHIDSNLVAIVKAHPGKRIIFVMGADHHGFAVDVLRRAFGTKIKVLVP